METLCGRLVWHSYQPARDRGGCITVTLRDAHKSSIDSMLTSTAPYGSSSLECHSSLWLRCGASLAQEPDQLVLSHMLEAVSDIVDVVKPALLSLEQLGQAFQRFKVVLDSSKQRRQERLQRRHAEDFDEDEADAIEVTAANPGHCSKATKVLLRKVKQSRWDPGREMSVETDKMLQEKQSRMHAAHLSAFKDKRWDCSVNIPLDGVQYDFLCTHANKSHQVPHTSHYLQTRSDVGHKVFFFRL